VLPLSASTTSYGRVVAVAREDRNAGSESPGEYVTTTTRRGAPLTVGQRVTTTGRG
jgi:hypothetical protein